MKKKGRLFNAYIAKQFPTLCDLFDRENNNHKNIPSID